MAAYEAYLNGIEQVDFPQLDSPKPSAHVDYFHADPDEGQHRSGIEVLLCRIKSENDRLCRLLPRGCRRGISKMFLKCLKNCSLQDGFLYYRTDYKIRVKGQSRKHIT